LRLKVGERGDQSVCQKAGETATGEGATGISGILAEIIATNMIRRSRS